MFNISHHPFANKRVMSAQYLKSSLAVGFLERVDTLRPSSLKIKPCGVVELSVLASID